jgi:hypothetical protein
MCDDIEATVSELTAKGVVFKGPVMDLGYGRGVSFDVPGADELFLYEPRHETAYDL